MVLNETKGRCDFRSLYYECRPHVVRASSASTYEADAVIGTKRHIILLLVSISFGGYVFHLSIRDVFLFSIKHVNKLRILHRSGKFWSTRDVPAECPLDAQVILFNRYLSLFYIQRINSGGFRGGRMLAPPPPRVGAPSYRESWIRP